MPEQRKTPARRAGAGEKTGIYVQAKPIPRTPARQELCQSCGYFKAVRSGQRLRTFCLFSGEKIRPSTPACEFWPGIAYADAVLDVPDSAIFGLTRGKRSGMVKAPNLDRRNKCLSAAPQRGKSLSANSAVGASPISGGPLPHIGRVQRPQVREAAAAYREPGSVVYPAFFAFNHQRQENLS